MNKEILFRKFEEQSDKERREILHRDFTAIPVTRDCDNCPKGNWLGGNGCPSEDPRIRAGGRKGMGFDCGDGRGIQCCWNSIISAAEFKQICKAAGYVR